MAVPQERNFARLSAAVANAAAAGAAAQPLVTVSGRLSTHSSVPLQTQSACPPYPATPCLVRLHSGPATAARSGLLQGQSVAGAVCAGCETCLSQGA